MNLAAIRRLPQRGKDLSRAARRRIPLLDHGIRAVEYTNEALGFQLAAGVTYYAFLSFFPLVALAYSIVGYVVASVPEAREAVGDTLAALLPGMVGDRQGQINVERIAAAKAGAGIIGLLGLLYAGLGWISSLRTALDRIFGGVNPPKRSFVKAKLADLRGLIVIGLGLLIGVSLGSLLSGYAAGLADQSGMGGWQVLTAVVSVLVSVLVGVATMTVLFFVTFRLLPIERPRPRAMWEGALLTALGFEVLRQLATFVVRLVTDNALYGVFAVLVALLIWINYTARLIIVGAAWASTR